jgi:hypothetical protein
MPRRLCNLRPSKDAIFGDFSEDASLPIVSYTAKGPPVLFVLSPAPTAVGGAIIITAPFAASQKAIVSYSVEVDTSVIGTQNDVTASIFDGLQTNAIDTYHHTIGNTAQESQSQATISWTLEVPGNGLARTFGVALSTTDGLQVPMNGCRGVVLIVPG